MSAVLLICEDGVGLRGGDEQEGPDSDPALQVSSTKALLVLAKKQSTVGSAAGCILSTDTPVGAVDI